MNVQNTQSFRVKPDVTVAIIGAGFSGLGMAIKLRQAGMNDFVILEKADDVGGTWRENQYPGCACDVPSHLYSFSFEPKADWTRAFSPQGEIWEYLRHCAEKYGLGAFIKYGREVTHAQFDEATSLWRITTADGQSLTAQHIVAGTGGLHIPSYPDIPGLDDFAGPVLHSAEWDHEVDLKDKKIVVIGTGASAIQFVPEIAPDAEHMTIFQRTAPWIMPKPDKEFSDKEKSRYSKLPGFRNLIRKLIFWRLELITWLMNKRPDLIQRAEKIGLDHIEASIKNPELRKKVTPNFRLGCKRVLMSNEWYQTLDSENVELDTDGIESIQANSVTTKDGRTIEADIILLGTGFRPFEMPDGLEVIGRSGKSLREEWEIFPEAYLGITVSGFPNYYLMLGPNTGLGSNSVVLMIEAQIQFAMDAIRTMHQQNIAFMDVREDVQRAYNDDIQKKLEGTVWTTGCVSWYQTRSGRNGAIWPGSTLGYRMRTHAIQPNNYEVVKAAPLPAAAE